MAEARVALIGCGQIGSRLARSLLAQGYALTVHDLRAEALAPLVAAGAVAAGSPREAAAGARWVLLSLPGSEAVERVVYGPAGLLDVLQPEQTLIDMTSSLPASTRRIAADLAARGVAMLDAPVTLSGGGLSILVGGPEAVFAAARPLLAALGTAVSWVGETGAGHVAKLCQNIVTGVHLAVAAEVLAFALKAGLDPERLRQALLTTGAADAARRFPQFLSRQFAGQGQMALHAKDMGYALATAREVGAALPFAATLHQVFQQALAQGDPLWTQVGVFTYFERAAGLQPPGDGEVEAR